MLGVIRSLQTFLNNVSSKRSSKPQETLILFENDVHPPIGEALALILQKNYCDLRHEGQKWKEEWQRVKERSKGIVSRDKINRGWILSISEATFPAHEFEGSIIDAKDLFRQLKEERKDLHLWPTTDIRNQLLIKALKYLQKKA